MQDLAASRSFEEAAFLIWHGELPGPADLAEFTAAERSQRELSRSVIAQLERLPDTCHPMDVLRSAVSAFGAEDPTEDAAGREALLAKSLAMMARLPTVVALGVAENVFHMMPEIGDPALTGPWLRDALERKRKIMGFGHRV